MECNIGSQNPIRDHRHFSHGELKIDFKIVENNLSIHIIEARRLSSKWTADCDSYVQVSLLPADSDSGWTSKTVKQSNNPAYNDTCLRCLAQGDEKKRLWVSVWHRDQNKQMTEFLGCMSFGLKHLVSKAKRKSAASGWYHLLSERVGHRKHLLATPLSSPPKRLPATPLLSTTPRKLLAMPLSSPPKQLPATPLLSTTPRKLLALPLCSPAPSTGYAPVSTPDDRLCAAESLKAVKAALLPTHTIVVYRTDAGFGFTVKNTCPVKIGRVRSSGPADEAGLRKGDQILKINGQNAESLSAMAVTAIVRQSIKTLALEIHRPSSKCRGTCKASNRGNHGNDSQRRTTLGHSVSDCDTQDENIPPLSDISQSDSGIRSDIYGLVDVPRCPSKPANQVTVCNVDMQNITRSDCSGACFTHELNSTELSRKSASTSAYTKWNPDISVIAQDDIQRNRHVISNCDITSSSSSSFNLLSKHAVSSVASRRSRQTTDESGIQSSRASSRKSSWDFRRRVISGNHGHHHGNQGPRHMAASHVSSKSTIDMSCLSYESSVDWSLLHGLHKETEEVQSVCRRDAVEHLFASESAFCEQMQSGIQQFSRPLRHCVLSTDQHTQLFQNVEKLVALSEYHLCQLKEDNYHGYNPQHSGHGSVEECIGEDVSVGEVYRPRMRLLRSAYKSYIAGLQTATSLLYRLRHQPKFAEFLKGTKSDWTKLEEFLRKPQRHLGVLLDCMREVRETLSKNHQDWTALCNIVQDMEEDSDTRH